MPSEEQQPHYRNIMLTVSYDGTEFHGWQRQPGLRTVQGSLEAALSEITATHTTCTGSGRTDAGVHALGQVCNFSTSSRLTPNTLQKGLNALLDPDLRVHGVQDVHQEFHATLDASSKRYRYLIDNGNPSDPFLRRYAWQLYKKLDAEAMNLAGQALLGRHDFRSFETDWPNRVTSVRTIFDVSVRRQDHRVMIEVEADGFLYNMVRAIAGTLYLVGTGRRSVEWVGNVVAAEDRTAAGPTAPPQGLYLLRVHYRPERLRPPEGPAPLPEPITDAAPESRGDTSSSPDD